MSATAEFNHQGGPLQRGDVYEDPLTEHLESLGAGEVDGGRLHHAEQRRGRLPSVMFTCFYSPPRALSHQSSNSWSSVEPPKGSRAEVLFRRRHCAGDTFWGSRGFWGLP